MTQGKATQPTRTNNKKKTEHTTTPDDHCADTVKRMYGVATDDDGVGMGLYGLFDTEREAAARKKFIDSRGGYPKLRVCSISEVVSAKGEVHMLVGNTKLSPNMV